MSDEQYDYDPETYGKARTLDEGIHRFDIISCQEHWKDGKCKSVQLELDPVDADTEYSKKYWAPLKGHVAAILDALGFNWKDYVGQDVPLEAFVSVPGAPRYLYAKVEPRMNKDKTREFMNVVQLIPAGSAPEPLKPEPLNMAIEAPSAAPGDQDIPF